MESVLLFLILLDLFLMNPLVSLKFFSHMKEGEEGGFSINAILTPAPAINYLMLLHPLLKVFWRKFLTIVFEFDHFPT